MKNNLKSILVLTITTFICAFLIYLAITFI